MKTIGRRIAHPISQHASSASLNEGAQFNDAIHRLPTGDTTFFPRGVYRYKTHEAANRHWDECVAQGMAALLRIRRK